MFYDSTPDAFRNRKTDTFEKRKKDQIKMIDISKLATALGKEVCKALVGVHSWTVCDFVISLIFYINPKFRTDYKFISQHRFVTNETSHTTCSLVILVASDASFPDCSSL